MKNALIAILLTSLVPTALLADELVDSAAPPACKKPQLPSSVRRADDTSEFQEKFTVYQDCIKSYIDTQNKLATLHVGAANKAVEEANAFVNETNAKLSGK